MSLGLGEHLILGGGERKSGGHRRESILADALEALFGAVYLDAGFDAAATVVTHAFADRLSNLPSVEDLRDPKTRLQEWLQSKGFGLPEYELVKVSGKAHRQQFDVSCSIKDGGQVSTGSGTTRRNAEQESAREMLAVIGEEVADA
jgi:ribonuclease-3